MLTKYIIYTKYLYNFFLFLSLTIFFFSTAKVHGKAFDINNVEISKPFEINFNKNKVIDEGFRKAFNELIYLVVSSADQKKINNIKLSEMKATIDSFSIKEEKFINETYYVNLGVSFNKKQIFRFLEKKNIFPSIPLKKKFLFIPILIDEKNKDLLIFDNKIFKEWNNHSESYHLIDYLLPTEDLEDINLIKKNFDLIEEYDFEEIIKKYYLDNSIISLIFKNKKEIRVLSRIITNKNIVLKNQTFSNINIDNQDEVKSLVKDLKLIYEDHWKKSNQINTSIKLSLNIGIKSSNNSKISEFEKALEDIDLINDFFISKFDKNYIYFQVIFNGTTEMFLKLMSENNFSFNTDKKIWILK